MLVRSKWSKWFLGKTPPYWKEKPLRVIEHCCGIDLIRASLIPPSTKGKRQSIGSVCSPATLKVSTICKGFTLGFGSAWFCAVPKETDNLPEIAPGIVSSLQLFSLQKNTQNPTQQSEQERGVFRSVWSGFFYVRSANVICLCLGHGCCDKGPRGVPYRLKRAEVLPDGWNS